MKNIKPILHYCDEEYEYPSNEQLIHGIQPGVLFSYVASTYLQGFINYVDIISAVLIHRYSETTEAFNEITARIEKQAKEHIEPHTFLSNYDDDMLILGKTKDMYVVFWVDKDCSDCNIGGLALDTFDSENDAISALYAEAEHLIERGDVRGYYKIPTEFFSGWIML